MPYIETARSFAGEISRKYDPDPDHGRHVAQLALAIFDGLQDIHDLGKRPRQLLEIASLLHDIGWSRVVAGKHHKLSRDMIQKMDIPGIDNQERFICALIARYHTKALPDAMRHRQFASLDPSKRNLVEWLAGILRVADGLDTSHAGLIVRVNCRIDSNVIRIELDSISDCRREVEKARQKQELLVKKTGRMIEYGNEQKK